MRRGFGFIGFTGAATLLMTSFYVKDPLLAMLSMGMASFCNDLTMPGSWATCMDVGGKFAGTVSGSMNMMGNFGGMAGPLVVGLVLQVTDRDWELVFADFLGHLLPRRVLLAVHRSGDAAGRQGGI